jgi:16S rRNA (guanine966-N2)-methyltransferase
MKMKRADMSKKKGSGKVRIIAGDWRGSRLPVPDLPGLRPSGDRCREMLFNWLQTRLPGAYCVDLFAGSGALGMEAASRGAGRVILIEKLSQAAAILQRSIDRLEAVNVELISADAIEWLHACEPQILDIAFIDPPFGLSLESRALELIELHDCMKPGGYVYVETASSAPVLNPGPAWQIKREKVLGDVRMLLLKKV